MPDQTQESPKPRRKRGRPAGVASGRKRPRVAIEIDYSAIAVEPVDRPMPKGRIVPAMQSVHEQIIGTLGRAAVKVVLPSEVNSRVFVRQARAIIRRHHPKLRILANYKGAPDSVTVWAVEVMDDPMAAATVEGLTSSPF